MSNLFLKKKNSKKSKNILALSNKNKIVDKYVKNVLQFNKEIIPAQKEWFNSIYSYNKNYVKNIPFYDKIVSQLIKSFFNLHYVTKKKLSWRKRKKRIRLKRLSINRILLSKAEILHTNKKAFFNLYIYNAEKRYLVNKLKKINISKLKNKRIFKNIITIKKLIKQISWFIKFLLFIYLKRNIKTKHWNKGTKSLKISFYNLFYQTNDEKKNLIFTKYILQKKILKIWIKKSLRKQILSNYYKYLLWINKSKFENTYIYPLYKLISEYYDKKIEFNIINLKYLHLNSSILSQFISIKIRNRKNRLLKVLYKYFRKLKIPIFDKQKKFFFRKKSFWLPIIYRTSLNSIFYNNLYSFFSLNKKSLNYIENEKHDILNQLIENKIQNKIQLKNDNRKYLVNRILNTIKHKWVYGVRLDLSGRLTRRFVAARSVSKKKYKGCLKNIDSSYKGFPSVILRGYLKSNIQYSKTSSKRKIGSFGVKGWISSL